MQNISENARPRLNLTQDLFLPTLLFAALGGMTWAVRGCSGFGAMAGCIFAGVTWGAAWWFIARDPEREQSRRYASAWIVLAVTVGLGISGARGWMQWPSFFDGKLMTNSEKGEFVPISRSYGFLWMFIAGVPWAGLGACMLAWCGSLRETRVWHWVLRIACGIGGAALARYLVTTYPQDFLPLYDSIQAKYQHLEANPSLRRLANDCGTALVHMGFFLGFLVYELIRRDWKNAVLISTVGTINGAGWALCQNWKWAPHVWPETHFNWWRCWESSGGISIGVAYGIAYFLVNRRMSEQEQAIVASRRDLSGPNFEWLLVYCGLTALLSLYVRQQMDGWGNYYFSVALAFGAIYYIWNGRRTADGALLSTSTTATIANAASAVVLAGVLIAGLYLNPRRLRRQAPFGDLMRTVGPIGLLEIGLGIVMLAGIAWYAIRARAFEEEKRATTPIDGDPNLERWGVYVGLLFGLGLSLRNGLKGWFNIYKGDEDYWSGVLWRYLGPIFLVCLIGIVGWVLFRPQPRDLRRNVFPHAHGLIWLVLIVQNAIAQLITGPHSDSNEVAFGVYYVLLFVVTAAITVHFRPAKPRIAM